MSNVKLSVPTEIDGEKHEKDSIVEVSESNSAWFLKHGLAESDNDEERIVKLEDDEGERIVVLEEDEFEGPM